MAKTYGAAKSRDTGKGGSFHVVGAKELELQLRKLLPDAVARKVARKAVSKAGTPVARAMRRNAKRVGEKHSLSRSIGKKTKGYSASQTAVTIVGPRTNYVDPDTGYRPSKTAHWVEYGIGPHWVEATTVLSDGSEVYGKKLQHPGVAAKPFARPAYDETRNQSKQIIAREIEAGILNHMASAAIGRKAKGVL